MKVCPPYSTACLNRGRPSHVLHLQCLPGLLGTYGRALVSRQLFFDRAVPVCAEGPPHGCRLATFPLRSEHERHSPNCPFVKGEHTQNVPLSVTLATSPAQFPSSADGSDKIACYGFGSCPQFLAAATRRGKICIWDVSKMMKVRGCGLSLLGRSSRGCCRAADYRALTPCCGGQVHLRFDINPYDPAILRQLILSGGEQNQQALTESRRPTLAWLEESSSCSDLPKLEGDR